MKKLNPDFFFNFKVHTLWNIPPPCFSLKSYNYVIRAMQALI